MSTKSVCYNQNHPFKGVSCLVNIRFIMEKFGQVADKERFNSIGPIESLYPDLAQNTVSYATEGERDPQSSISTRVLYWYHPDYVGNVDLVTDLNQEACEFYLYNPWGESLYHWESGSSSWNSPFRFNSKEFDAETGMHYYGARYHHPKLSVWMSVDALANIGPEHSVYSYTQNNPITLIDPDGNWPNDPDEETKADSPETNERFCSIGFEIKQIIENLPSQQPDQSSDNRTVNSNSGNSERPDENSFNFTNTGSNWQEAATVGMYFNIALLKLSPKGVQVKYKATIRFDQPILFGAPANLKVGNTDLSNELAAQLTALAVSSAMSTTSKKFAQTNATPTQIEQFFRAELKRVYPYYIPGGRVNFNAMNLRVTPTKFRHSWF